MGLGYGWLPYYQAKPHLQDGSLVEVDPQLNIDLPLYWHHWKQQSMQLNLLTDLLIEQAHAVMN